MKKLIKISIRVNQDFYPELLHKMFIINAPWLFRSVWAMAKAWVDKHTASKITMSKKIPLEKFLKIIGMYIIIIILDNDHIMEEYGGSGQGDFKLTVGLYKNDLDSAFNRNSVWMDNTLLYRKFIYDADQVLEEEKEEQKLADELRKQKEIEENLLKEQEVKRIESKLNQSVLEMLKVFDR